MNTLAQLAELHTMVLLDSQALLEAIRIDREVTFLEGVKAGLRQAELEAIRSSEEPLTKEEAAKVLGFSKGTIDNMRKRGDLESYEYGGQVRIEWEEIRRWKRLHSNLYNKSKKLQK